MEFNPSKCQLLQITSSSSKKPIPTSYSLHGQTLETADHAKYLGVVIGSTLKWIFHISRITCNANRSLGFVRRNIKCKNPKIREAAYKSLVRPQLEFVTSAWDPHCQGHIKQIEQVQRRAARWTLNDYRPQASVSTMLSTLGWRPLQQRRAVSTADVVLQNCQWLCSNPSATKYCPSHAQIEPWAPPPLHASTGYP